MVLAGGLGTRLSSITGGTPKPLAPVSGHPFLYWKMSYLVSSGFSEFVFCLGYGASEIRSYLESAWPDVRKTYIQDRFPNCGTGLAVVDAFSFVEEGGFVTYADNLTSVDLASMSDLAALTRSSVMAVQSFDEKTEQRGNVQYVNEGSTIRYAKNSGGALIDHGISFLTLDFFSDFVSSVDAMSLEEMFELQSSKGRLLSVNSWREFLEIGTPNSYVAAQDTIEAYYKGYEFHT